MEKTLKLQIEEYPLRLEEALLRFLTLQDKADKLKEMLDNHCIDDDSNLDSSIEERKKSIKLEYEQKRLKLQLEEAKGIAETKHRQAYPKATTSSAEAAVNADAKVIALQSQILDLEEQCQLAAVDTDDEGQSDFTTKLKDDLIIVEHELNSASAVLEGVKASFECFKLLLELEKNTLPSVEMSTSSLKPLL